MAAREKQNLAPDASPIFYQSMLFPLVTNVKTSRLFVRRGAWALRHRLAA
jgi:hypothetical protein